MKKVILILTLGLLGMRTAAAEGTSMGSFLKMGAGARAAAMGESFVAIANDATATYWNPAGIARIDETQISAMQNTHVVDTSYQHLAAVKPLGRFGVGLSVSRMNYGSIDRYTAADVKDGNFTANSLATGVSLAGRIGDEMSVGATLKMIQESIESESASGMAADLGVLYDMNGFTIGASAQNIGPAMKMVRDSFALPMTVRLGVSTHLLDKKMLLSGGFSKPNDSAVALQAGLEYNLTSMFTLRGGYKLTSGASDLGGLVGVTGGFGLQFSRFTLDYAMTPFGDLGLSQRLSLLIRFSPTAKSY